MIDLLISPHGRPLIATDCEPDGTPAPAALRRTAQALDASAARGLLHLATVELQTTLPPGLSWARGFASDYLTRLCHTPGLGEAGEIAAVAPPPEDELAAVAQRCPPLLGSEYLTAEVLAAWWGELDELVRAEARQSPGGAQEYLRQQNPVWRLVGRVTFHLAENKRDPAHPFAFLATYASRLSAQARVQHQPLGRALQEYAGARNRSALVALLTPVERATQLSPLAKELVESGDVYQPLAWTAREAYRFLQDIPKFEESGLIVRVPDWWRAQRPPRPIVSVKVGDQPGAKLGADRLLDFSVDVALDGEPLSKSELQALLDSADGLVVLKGRWVEVDRDRLNQALRHWKTVAQQVRGSGLTFFEGMRLLSGASYADDVADEAARAAPEWTGISAGPALEQVLRELRDPQLLGSQAVPHLQATLRPYQQTGVAWLRFMTRLGLGACLADDMGLGKTIQVIALLLHIKHQRSAAREPSLLVVPASLIANWKSELARFGPSLDVRIVHPSEMPAASGRRGKAADEPSPAALVAGCDLAITTYGMLARLDPLRERRWNVVVLDEAQAIKNSGSRQTRAVKDLSAAARLALTGTPIENRLSDLWSLFDFLNPGLLGSAKQFAALVKQSAAAGGDRYGSLRSLVQPYILRRLKTDKRVIADLPEKTEVNAYCGLSKRQAALYERAVRELAATLKDSEGIQRRGTVLAFLMRFKQICNHPSQATGDAGYEPRDSAKFQRLAELCGELAERQQKALVFTQFREITAPLAEFLAGVFGRPGLVLTGQTAVGKRRELVEAFQRETGPPFFVLSLKAGGTGLNLTEAAHVIHFDRWWNPAVENQATDRAFRIGQKHNVVVHKFVCRGTIEERIDEMLTEKSDLSRSLLDAGGETLLTEMNDEQLLKFVSLDVRKALET
ncbi:MAG TPA: DEAD/DEAH box helicase [Pirellulales bacterium]|nr:DEAD/DEAH box helicase [Pirellulales bacterium]